MDTGSRAWPSGTLSKDTPRLCRPLPTPDCAEPVAGLLLELGLLAFRCARAELELLGANCWAWECRVLCEMACAEWLAGSCCCCGCWDTPIWVWAAAAAAAVATTPLGRAGGCCGACMPFCASKICVG